MIYGQLLRLILHVIAKYQVFSCNTRAFRAQKNKIWNFRLWQSRFHLVFSYASFSTGLLLAFTTNKNSISCNGTWALWLSLTTLLSSPFHRRSLHSGTLKTSARKVVTVIMVFPSELRWKLNSRRKLRSSWLMTGCNKLESLLINRVPALVSCADWIRLTMLKWLISLLDMLTRNLSQLWPSEEVWLPITSSKK